MGIQRLESATSFVTLGWLRISVSKFKRTENHNFTITTNTSQHVEFFHSLIFLLAMSSLKQTSKAFIHAEFLTTPAVLWFLFFRCFIRRAPRRNVMHFLLQNYNGASRQTLDFSWKWLLDHINEHLMAFLHWSIPIPSTFVRTMLKCSRDSEFDSNWHPL